MTQKEIIIGETYIFIATENPARKHLEGETFTVVSKKAVWRRAGKRGKRKQNRFFNADGVGARAEELGEMPEPGKAGEETDRISGTAFKIPTMAQQQEMWDQLPESSIAKQVAKQNAETYDSWWSCMVLDKLKTIKK